MTLSTIRGVFQIRKYVGLGIWGSLSIFQIVWWKIPAVASMRCALVLTSFAAIRIVEASRSQIRHDASPVVIARQSPAVFQSETKLTLLKSGECQGDSFWGREWGGGRGNCGREMGGTGAESQCSIFQTFDFIIIKQM
jgi:hypothetical protein